MANETPTTVETPEAPKREVSGKFTNPRDLQFPFDPHGFTTLLRKEGARAVGRIKGDKAKLAILIDTLKVLGEHAREKMADQVKDTEQRVAAAANREKAEYARALADQKAEVSRLEGLLTSAKAAVKAKAAMPGKAAADE